jgi:hypothetical protein
VIQRAAEPTPSLDKLAADHARAVESLRAAETAERRARSEVIEARNAVSRAAKAFNDAVAKIGAS